MASEREAADASTSKGARLLRRALTPAQAFAAGVALQDQGRLAEAEQVYRALLQLVPAHASALHRLGTICRNSGRIEESLELLGRAVETDSQSALANNDLGIAFALLRRPQDALPCFARAVELEPGFADAHNHLGNAQFQLGRYAEAAASFERALAAQRDFAEAYNNLGNALSALDRRAEAIAYYDQAAELKPELAEAHCNAGIALAAIGWAEQAVARYEKALAVRPDYADAHAGIGKALASLGRHRDALAHFERALALEPNSPVAHNRLGNALAALGRPEEAIAHYRKAIDLRPELVEAHSNLGSALAALDRPEEAVEHFRAALAAPVASVAQISHQAHHGLGAALAAIDRPADAVAHYRAALSAKPDFAEAHSNLGSALVELNRPEEAIPCFAQALAIDPGLASAHHGMGLAALALGRLEQSRREFERAVELAPARLASHRSLAEAKSFTPGDTQLAALEQMARDVLALSEEDQIDLHFALGKAYADLKQHEASFRQLLAGNALKRRQIDYDEAVAIGGLTRCRAVFTPELMQRLRGFGDPSETPIFIVGMPRSGTTLVEQVLASHPEVFGAGEIEHFGRAAANICEPPGATVPYPEMLRVMPGEALRALGARYLEAVLEAAPSAAAARRVTDKLPANFRLVGLIHLALPNARIIHVRRDPVDTCFSCFTKLFKGLQPFTYDLGELGRYYAAYQALMAHWRAVLPPGIMLEVQYEDLVADFAPQARAIVAHCGLQWSDACLAFHETPRPVRTASAAQVRQPIYQSAVGRWRAYEPWLGPLLTELGAPR